MSLTVRCYCRCVCYRAEGAPMTKGQCCYRKCQYISGGGPNNFVAMPVAGFRYTQGEAKQFSRADFPNPVTREFYPHYGTSLTTRAPGWLYIEVKVGALDDASPFKPQAAIQLADKQPYGVIPEGVAQFERWPPM